MKLNYKMLFAIVLFLLGGNIALAVTAPPTFSTPPGIYSTAQGLILSSATPGAKIYFTFNGGSPTTSSIPYNAPIVVNGNTRVQAVAVANGVTSSVATAAYSFVAIAPTISVKGKTVTIADVSPTATIYYTIDGSTPTTYSKVYKTPVVLTQSATVQTIAHKRNWVDSSVVSASVDPQTAAPVLSVQTGTYYTGQTVTINDTTPGAKVYITSDGSQPTTSSYVYIHPLLIKQSTTLTAIAISPDYTPSTKVSASYTLTTATPVVSVVASTQNNKSIQTVTITTPYQVDQIAYTLDGSVPNWQSAAYKTPLVISKSVTLNVIAIGNGDVSSVVTVPITVEQVAVVPDPVVVPSGPAAPVVSVVAGTYRGIACQSVSITTASAVDMIVYTVDGTTPTFQSSQYTGTPIIFTSKHSVQLNVLTIANGVSSKVVSTTVPPVVTH